MTIVKDSRAIRFHVLSAIDEDVGNLIARTEFARAGSQARSAILLSFKFLEAYCDVTDHRISMATIRSPAIEKILQGFTAAMAGKELVDLEMQIAKDAPINLPHGGGKSKFPRDAPLFAKKRPMLRVLRAISSGLPC